MNKPAPESPEFFRPVRLEKIPPSGIEETLEASPLERRRLAERFGLLDLPRLSGLLTVMPGDSGRTADVQGKIVADVVQRCVVTLDPLPSHIELEIDVRFTARPDERPGHVLPDDATENDDDVEPIVNGIIDLGELAAQHLGVALDPWPRKPGVEYLDATYGDTTPPVSPFARLAELKGAKTKAQKPSAKTATSKTRPVKKKKKP